MMMKSFGRLSFVAAVIEMVPVMAEEHSTESSSSCAHGKLYLTDNDSPMLRIIDLNTDSTLANLTVEHSMAVPGHNGQWLELNPSATIVKVISWGNESLLYADGQVHFVHTGVASTTTETGAATATERASVKASFKSSSSLPPTLIEGTVVECPQPYHLTYHDTMLVISCDGSYDADPPVDNSYWIVDQALIEQQLFGTDDGTTVSTTESAVVKSISVPGSIHGSAFYLGNQTLLHPLPTPDRLARVNTTDMLVRLPATFQVVDFKGTVLDAINDTSNVNRYCSANHGSTYLNDTITLACGQDHGGILVAQWNAQERTTTTRSLMYPTDFATLRVGDWSGQHARSQFVVSDLSDWFAVNVTEYHLMAMERTATESLTSANVLTLDTKICGYGFEKTNGQTLVALLATGVLQLYTVDPTWTLVSEIKPFVKNMTSCVDAGLAIGYNQVFAMSYGADRTLYAVNLDDDNGSFTIETTTLDFNPFHAVVAKGCGSDSGDGHNETHDDHSGRGHNDTGSGGGGGSSTTSSSSSSAMATGVCGMMVATIVAAAAGVFGSL